MNEHPNECTTGTPKPLKAKKIINDFAIHGAKEVRESLNNLLLEFMAHTDAAQDERADFIASFWAIDSLLVNIINYEERRVQS